MSKSARGANDGLRWWTVGYLAPRLIALALATDVILRLMPSGWLGLEVVAMYANRLPNDAYVRNYQAQARIAGDLSLLANLPGRRIYRSVSLTTDALGFRNAGPINDPAGMVVGDSFSNAGSSSDEHLAAQVGQSTGCRVYNAAGEVQEIQAPPAQRVVDLARYLGMRGGLVVAARVERLGPPRSPGPGATRVDFGRTPSLVDRGWTWLSVTPGRFLAEAALKRISDDRILPNVYRHTAIERTLSNGDWMLFFEDEMKNYEAHRFVSIEYWTRLQVDLAPASLQLLVVLVPNKYTVYYSHVVGANRPRVAPEEYLDATEAALRQAGVPVLNLTAVLQREATEALRRGEYLYHRDDTHWNAVGIGVAAREIARVWIPAAGRSCP